MAAKKTNYCSFATCCCSFSWICLRSPPKRYKILPKRPKIVKTAFNKNTPPTRKRQLNCQLFSCSFFFQEKTTRASAWPTNRRILQGGGELLLKGKDPAIDHGEAEAEAVSGNGSLGRSTPSGTKNPWKNKGFHLQKKWFWIAKTRFLMGLGAPGMPLCPFGLLVRFFTDLVV